MGSSMYSWSVVLWMCRVRVDIFPGPKTNNLISARSTSMCAIFISTNTSTIHTSHANRAKPLWTSTACAKLIRLLCLVHTETNLSLLFVVLLFVCWCHRLHVQLRNRSNMFTPCYYLHAMLNINQLVICSNYSFDVIITYWWILSSHTWQHI